MRCCRNSARGCGSMASRIYRPCFSACSCCRAVRSIPAHHHAFGNAFFRSPPETCRACPTAFWPHSAGSTASDLYDAGVIDPSSFDRAGIGLRPGPRPSWSKHAIGGGESALRDARFPYHAFREAPPAFAPSTPVHGVAMARHHCCPAVRPSVRLASVDSAGVRPSQDAHARHQQNRIT